MIDTNALPSVVGFREQCQALPDEGAARLRDVLFVHMWIADARKRGCDRLPVLLTGEDRAYIARVPSALALFATGGPQ